MLCPGATVLIDFRDSSILPRPTSQARTACGTGKTITMSACVHRSNCMTLRLDQCNSLFTTDPIISSSISGSTATPSIQAVLKVVGDPQAIKQSKALDPSSPVCNSEDKTGENTLQNKEVKPYQDPLIWFGVLVPPVLRQSQAEFKQAVTDVIPSIANTKNELRDLEIEIQRTRKKIKRAR